MAINAKPLIFLCLMAAATALTDCGGRVYAPESLSLRFAVTGNTGPESPFSGFNDRFPDLIRAINTENPVIAIHTGNAVHGGHDWMGINEKDMIRQYKIFCAKVRAIHAPLYILPGERDLHNGSSRLFRQYTESEPVYSFNYGAIHIAMVPLVEIEGLGLDDQIRWLDRDLRENRRSPSVLLITHTPPVNPQGNRLPEDAAAKLHSVLLKYPVRGVISGGAGKLSETTKDGVRYIVAGCGGYAPEDRFKNLCQFYMVRLNGSELHIECRKL